MSNTPSEPAQLHLGTAGLLFGMSLPRPDDFTAYPWGGQSRFFDGGFDFLVPSGHLALVWMDKGQWGSVM